MKNQQIIFSIVCVFFFGTFLSNVQLGNTQGETRKTRHFVCASSNNSPPMNVLDKDGDLIGFGRDFADAVIKEIGGEVKHIHSSHWEEVLEWLNNGKADFIHDTGYTKEKDKFLDYSEPIIEMPETIFVQSDEYSITDLESLKGKTVACVNKHTTHTYLQQFPDISLFIVKTPAEGIYELISGKVDAFIYPKQIVLYLIQNLRLQDKIKITGESLRTLTWSMVVKKGNNELLQQLNEGILRVKKSGQYERILNKWWGKKVLDAYTKRELLLYVTMVTGALLTVLLTIAFFLFNRSLRKKQQLLQAEIIERQKVEDKLFNAIEIINRSSAVIFRFENAEDWPVEYVSKNVVSLFGYSAKSFLSAEISYSDCIYPDDLNGVLHDIAKNTGQKEKKGFVHEPYRIITSDGSIKWLEHKITFIRNDNGNITHFEGIIQDISSQVEFDEKNAVMEEMLQQAQKMESVGRLAGGVAHDFNNILSAIIGYAEMCLMKMENENPFREKITIILESGQRAGRLTQQLLAFSRKQIIRPEFLDLNHEITDTCKMLKRLLGEDIELKINNTINLWPVKIDRSQLEQVVLNLAINARDAMPTGGNITIETANISLDEAYIEEHQNIMIGDYVMLAVSDNGKGMDKDTKKNIFEPFFTTKKKGQGTGLGLATVYGIIKQNHGEIMVYSEPGQGTTFKIYIPRTKEVIEEKGMDSLKEDVDDYRGTETILLVEDDNVVRIMIVDILMELGYTVLEAENGKNALQICTRFHGTIDLLLTDVVMPEMSGPVLAKEMQENYPKTKILFMSGYTEKAIVKHGILADNVNFIHKPLTRKALAKTVRKVIG